jgi:molecular chaperone HscB
MLLARSATTGRLITGKSRALATMMFPGVSSSVDNSHVSSRYRLFSSSDACATAIVDDEDDNQATVVDYFSLLGVSRRFLLDPKELKSSYRQLMTKYHPDMRNQRQGDDDDDDDDDTNDASEITHAYHTLRKPHTRATHLLELVGRPMEEETTNAASLVGPGFLMHVMEMREDIDSIAGLQDGRSSEDATRELEELLSSAQQEMEEVLEELDKAFQHDHLDKALELSAQLQYLHRIEETIVEKL